jgi:hypothetical protein
MNRRDIFKTIKNNKKFILIFSIIFLSGIIIGLSISTISFSSTKKYYVATEDICIYGDDIVRGNPPSGFYHIRVSSFDGNYVFYGVSGIDTATPDYKGFLMRFNLKNAPRSWSKCEISLYIYDVSYYGYTVSASMYLFEANWSESTESGTRIRDLGFIWEIEDPIGGVNNKNVGFDRTDITEYIHDIPTDTFSIIVVIRSTQYVNGIGRIYSSEWDGKDPLFPYVLPENDSYKNYLPQLIWS